MLFTRNWNTLWYWWKVKLWLLKLTASMLRLAEALEELEKDEVIKNALGANLYEAFVRAKRCEWDDYRIHVTDWEIERYLENA